MTTLQYSALDADNSEIRLLDIDPGDDDDDIRCSLRVVSLNSHPQYEALSYVWGDPSITKDVTVDGVSLPVTVNLESALRDLRYPSERRTTWVDAICINQANVIEKNHQLPLMGDIYQKASGVVAYLEHSSMCMGHFLDWLYPDSRNRPFLDNLIPPTDVRAKDILSLIRYLGVLEFSCHGYFHRMWTFQEVLLPSRGPVFVIGKMSFQMVRFPYQFWGPLCQMHAENADEASERLSGETEPEVQELLRLHDEINTRFMLDYHANLQQHDIGNIFVEASKFDILNLFYATKIRKCSDPRDKIFALHALVQKLVPGINAPDYNKSVDAILLETLSNFHTYKPSLIQRFMMDWPLRASSAGDASGPSWLPDITATKFSYMEDPLSTEHTDVTLRISSDFRILTLGGRLIGKCHPSPIKLGGEAEETLRRIAGLLYSSEEDLHSFADSEIRMRTKEHGFERIFYTLGAWVLEWDNLEDSKGLPSILKIIAKNKGTGKLGDIPLSGEQKIDLVKAQMAAPRLTNKAFFWTDTGLFGTCSERLQEGDTIVMTSEFPRLLAVRPLSDLSGESNHYSMVDWVFVDGLGGGVATDAELVNKIRETPLSDIHIH